MKRSPACGNSHWSTHRTCRVHHDQLGTAQTDHVSSKYVLHSCKGRIHWSWHHLHVQGELFCSTCGTLLKGAVNIQDISKNITYIFRGSFIMWPIQRRSQQHGTSQVNGGLDVHICTCCAIHLVTSSDGEKAPKDTNDQKKGGKLRGCSLKCQCASDCRRVHTCMWLYIEVSLTITSSGHSISRQY